MRTLGIDPGTAITGYGIVEQGRMDVVAITYGVVRTPASATLPERLLSIHEQLAMLIERFLPEVVAVEQLFFSKNVQTAFSVGQARGAVLLTAAQRGLAVFEYTPPQVKLAIAGYGGAKKEQMQLMVQRLLNLSVPPEPDDAADALAVAICHLRGEPLRSAVAQAQMRAR